MTGWGGIPLAKRVLQNVQERRGSSDLKLLSVVDETEGMQFTPEITSSVDSQETVLSKAEALSGCVMQRYISKQKIKV
jgi:hypothetical protein